MDSSNFLKIRFEIPKPLSKDQYLIIAGDLQQLGEWNPSNGLILDYDPSVYLFKYGEI